jgi:hypothetical protein
MNTLIFALPMWIAGLLTSALDYYVSVQGIKQGLAEEGNWIVRKIYGGKPNPLQLLTALLPQDIAVLTLATVLLHLGPALVGVGIGVAFGQVLRHISNIHAWEKFGVKF